jgi:hypothetical protein
VVEESVAGLGAGIQKIKDFYSLYFFYFFFNKIKKSWGRFLTLGEG